MIIRDFGSNDAAACLRIRRQAICSVFTGRIGDDDVTAHLNAYAPADLIRLSEEGKSFVAEDNGQIIGFCTIRKESPTVADMPFIYISLRRLKEGIGSALMNHMEEWIPRNWPDVSWIELETVVPEYNRRFYERHGYEAVGPCDIVFPDKTVPALRMKKPAGMPPLTTSKYTPSLSPA